MLGHFDEKNYVQLVVLLAKVEMTRMTAHGHPGRLWAARGGVDDWMKRVNDLEAGTNYEAHC